MADSGPLDVEIARLLECPYPPSLKRLDTLLSECNDIDLQTWANLNPCQVGPLVSTVLQSFRALEYVLRIVANLSRSKALRDALLETDPYLIDALLTKVNSRPAEPANADSFLTCVALLSHPLPNGILLPASAQKFLLHAVEKAAISPTATTLRHVLQLLDGACHELLGILPDATLTSLADDIFKTLRNITSVEGEPLYLICLGILRRLAGLPTSQDHDGQYPPGPDTSSLHPQGLRSARSYFVDSKAPKTLQLVALQVMWVYKIEDSRSEQLTVADLELATTIINSMPNEVKTEWCKANALVVRKIIDKTTKEHLTASVKLAGLIFAGFLVIDPSGLPSTARRTAHEALLESLKTRTHPDRFRDMIRVYLKLYSAVIDPQQVSDLLVRCLNSCANTDSVPLSELRLVMIVVQELSDRCRVCESLRRAVLDVLGPQDAHCIQRRVLGLVMRLETASTLIPSVNDRACGLSVPNASYDLAVAIQHFLVELMLLERKQEFCISGSDISRLLCATKSNTVRLPSCRHITQKPDKHTSLPDSTNDPAWTSHTWTAQLHEVLQGDLHSRQASILRMVNEVCDDLQVRCDEVEKPLRDEKERNDKLDAKRAALETQLLTLQETLAEKQRDHDMQKSEGTALVAQLVKAESTTDSLLARVEDLEAALLAAQDAAESEMQGLRCQHETIELAHQGELAAATEELEKLQEQMRVQGRDFAIAREETSDLAARLEIEQKNRAALADTLIIRQHELDASETAQLHSSHQLADSLKAEASLTARLMEVEDVVKQKAVEINTLTIQLSKDEATAAKNLESTNTAHAKALELLRTAKEVSEQQNCVKIETIRAEVEAEQLSHRTTQDQLRNTNLELEESIAIVKKLRVDLQGTHVALQEAQDMRKRLVQAMGLKDETMASPTTGQRRSRRIASDRAPTVLHTTGSRGLSTGQASFESGASSSGGPTPKRTKPRPSFVVPSLHTSHPSGVQASVAKRTLIATRTRQPLQDTPARGNARIHSPEKSIEKSRASKEAQTNLTGHDLHIDDLEFDASSLFTSTPSFPTVPSNNDERFEAYDDTTADL